MSKRQEALTALRVASPADASVLTDSEFHSVSDGVAQAVRAAQDGPSLEELVAAITPDNVHPEEPSKPAVQDAPQAPALLPTGVEAIRLAGEATEADRVREYAMLAEIEAEVAANEPKLDQLLAVIEATEATLEKARADKLAIHKRNDELAAQRAETVDRIVSLNQMTIDNEAARLRRG